MAAVALARTREATVVGRLAGAARVAAPGLRRAARRARSLVLHVAGLGSITAEAWTVATGLGLLAAGVSQLLLEYLTAEQAV